MEAGAVILVSERSGVQEAAGLTPQPGALTAVQRLAVTFQQAGIGRLTAAAPFSAGPAVEKQLARMGVICLCSQDREACSIWDEIKLGLSYLQKRCSPVLLVPDTVPFFTVDTVRALLQAGAAPAWPVWKGRTGYPVLVTAEQIPDLLAYQGSEGLKDAVARCGFAETLIEVADPGILPETEKDCTARTEPYKRQKLHPALKLRLAGEQPFFGPGTAQLLELIDETNSVRLACRQMGVSYSKGWKMIQLMEEEMGRPAVARQQGGKNGGAAFLTQDGRIMLEKYRQFEQRCRQAVQELFHEIFLKGN